MDIEAVPSPEDPEEQEALWRELVSAVGAGARWSFEQHWAAFQRIYANRKAEDGPPPAWIPEPGDVARSNLGRLMVELGFRDYQELHAWSVRAQGPFWENAIRSLDIVFDEDPAAILDMTPGVRNPSWLPGAQLNCVDSCFKAGMEEPAILSGREGSDEIVTTTYGELETLVNRVANGLMDEGFEEGDAIGLYMPMTLECVAAYLGIVRAGCRVVSVASSFPARELARRLNIGGARGLVTVRSFERGGKTIGLYDKVREAEAPRAIVIGTGEGDDLRPDDLAWEDLLSANVRFASSMGEPYRVTNVLFSSGTTGTPKAIPWTHLTPIKAAMDGRFHNDIRPGELVAWPTDIGWMMGPWLIYASLMNDTCMALYEGSPAGPEFARFVQEAGVAMLGVVPSLVRSWRASGALEGADWSRVRVFSSTGEPSDRESTLWLMSRAGYRAPVIEYCGGTEVGGGYVTGTLAQPASPATFSTPALGIDFFVLDHVGRPVEPGGMGEAFLVPPCIGLSQWLLNRDHDEVYYRGCPTGPNGQVLRRHGDQLTRLHRGYYRAQGRADDTMNLGGIKVSSLELEQVMSNHPAVYECAAVAVQPRGEGAEQLVVYAVLKPKVDARGLHQELDALLAQRLNPLFKIDDLVVTQSLPYTASNKLTRRELRERYMEEREP